MTSANGREAIEKLGAEPVVMDGLDGASAGGAVARAKLNAIIHETTALSCTASPRLRRGSPRYRLRAVGTHIDLPLRP
jgi:hypothetical protein